MKFWFGLGIGMILGMIFAVFAGLATFEDLEKQFEVPQVQQEQELGVDQIPSV